MSSRTLALLAVVIVAIGWVLLFVSKRRNQPLYSISIGFFSMALLILALRSGQIHLKSGGGGVASEAIGYSFLALAGSALAVVLFLRRAKAGK